MSNLNEHKSSSLTTLAKVLWLTILVVIIVALVYTFDNPPKVDSTLIDSLKNTKIIINGDTIMTNEFGEVINNK